MSRVPGCPMPMHRALCATPPATKVQISFMQDRSADRQVQPGMTVDAEIISGSKSLLQYMLKPIFRGVDVASSEH